MATFLVILVAAFVGALVALNVHASRRCWRDEMSARGQRLAQIAFVWLVPGLGAGLALHLVPGRPEGGGRTRATEQGADLDDFSDYGTADADGYANSPGDGFSSGGDASSH